MPYLFHVALSLRWAHQQLCAYLHLYYLFIFWLSRLVPCQTSVQTIHIPLCSYGLLGPSGCGKTTLLKCIVGTLKISRGRITVLGKPPAFPGHQVPGRMVGYMPQVWSFMHWNGNFLSFLFLCIATFAIAYTGLHSTSDLYTYSHTEGPAHSGSFKTYVLEKVQRSSGYMCALSLAVISHFHPPMASIRRFPTCCNVMSGMVFNAKF